MKKLDLKQMENVEGGKFFGKDKKCTQCFWGKKTCINTFYVFGMVLGQSWETEEYC